MSDLTKAEQKQVFAAAKHLFEWSRRQEVEVDFDLRQLRDERAHLAYALHYETWKDAGPTLWNDAIVQTIWDLDHLNNKDLLVGDLFIKSIDRSWHCIIRIVIDTDDYSIIDVDDAYGTPDRLTQACFNWFLMTKLMLP